MLMVAWRKGGQLLFRLLGQLETYEDFLFRETPSWRLYGTFTVQSNFSWKETWKRFIRQLEIHAETTCYCGQFILILDY